MSSPSALLKVNYLVIRHLPFRNARGDLQEDHIYDKRLCGYASLMPIPRLLEHKIGVFVSERATFPRFCPLSSTKLGYLCSGTVITERA